MPEHTTKHVKVIADKSLPTSRLFRMTWATRCSACKNCDEQHEKRHREIAEMVHVIKKTRAEGETVPVEMLMSPTTPKTPTCRTPLTAKALKTIDSPMTPVNGIQKTTKKERKAAKKVAKAMDRDKFVTTADILLVARVLHPEPEKDADNADADIEAMAEDEEIKRNLRFNYSTCNTKSIRQSYIDKERSGQQQHQVQDADINAMLEQFEIDVDAVGKEGELVKELTKAIKSDLLHFHEEVESTARNKAGFWRWANKKHYRALMDRGKDWDDKHKPMESGETNIVEERRDSATASDPEGEDQASPTSSRRGSIGVPSLTHSSGTNSDSTVLTVPSSSKPTSSAKKTPVLSLTIPSTPVKVTKSAPVGDPGWTKVGKKVLSAPPKGKVTLAGNGGLKHLHLKPKGKFGALSWADTARSD